MARRSRRIMGSGLPSRALTSSLTSVTCMSANTSANCAWRAPRKAPRLPSPSTLTWNEILIFGLRSAFVQTLQAKAVLELAKADLEYYDKIIDISRARFKAGDLAKIDLARIELQRVQYESEIETAIVNLRTAEDSAPAAARRPHAGRSVRCNWGFRPGSGSLSR